MQKGKISEIAYKRSVLKKISCKHEGVNVGMGCAPIELEDVTLVMSSNCIFKWFDGVVDYTFTKTLNEIYEQKAKPKYVQLEINIPTDFEEKKLGKIIRAFNERIEDKKLVLAQCRVYASDINEVVTHITIVGIASRVFRRVNIKPGMDIVMANKAAMGATFVMSKTHKEKLLEKFQSRFVDECIEMGNYLDIKQMCKVAYENNPASIHAVSDGGIFGALWEMASSVNLGLEVQVKNIQIWQETVEVAEYFDYNPYIVDGTGAVLIATNEGDALVNKLNEGGFAAGIIGKFTESNDRVVINGEEKRFLEPPKGDEIYNFL